jgi:hypothetical protein
MQGRHQNSSRGAGGYKEKNQENRTKQPMDPETVLEGSAKDQTGQKGKQEVWVARVMQGRYQNSSRGSRRQRGRFRKIRPNNWWIRKRCWRVQQQQGQKGKQGVGVGQGEEGEHENSKWGAGGRGEGSGK